MPHPLMSNVTETPLGTSATENYLSDDDASIVVDDYGIVGLIRYNDKEDELLAPPLQPLPPILQVDLDKKRQHYENEEGVMCISAPTINQIRVKINGCIQQLTQLSRDVP